MRAPYNAKLHHYLKKKYTKEEYYNIIYNGKPFKCPDGKVRRFVKFSESKFKENLYETKSKETKRECCNPKVSNGWIGWLRSFFN